MNESHLPIRVCYFGTYREKYARNQIMIEGLRRAGMDVVECHETLWRGVEDRIQIASGGWLHPEFWLRVLKTYARLLQRYRNIKDYDVLITGYPGQYDVFLAKLLSQLRRKPLVWDVLNSMYLIAFERGLASSHPFTAHLIRFLEYFACRQPDRLILDTNAFVAWFHKIYKIKPERFCLVPIGADAGALQQGIRESNPSPAADGLFKLIYYGSYIPNHGVDIIVEAAKLLKDETGIYFDLVGEGPEKERTVDLVQRYGLKNVTITNWLERDELYRRIMASDICLGTFGDTLQASLTNNNKIFEGFAMKKPIISGISPAVPDILRHGEHLFLCERGNPKALAEAILTLKNDHGLCSRLGENGFRVLHENFDVTHIGEAFASCIREVISK